MFCVYTEVMAQDDTVTWFTLYPFQTDSPSPFSFNVTK